MAFKSKLEKKKLKAPRFLTEKFCFYKYAHLYKQTRLRPPSNLLLFGAPGTGKTLLAGVAATTCHLNLITVKVIVL